MHKNNSEFMHSSSLSTACNAHHKPAVVQLRTIFSRTKGNRRGHEMARALAMHLQRVENKKSDKFDASPGVNGAITQVTPPIRLVKALFF